MSSRWVREGRRTGAATPAESDAAPRLQPPLGQGPVFAAWLSRARRLVLPHALLVEGPRGVGKTTVVRWLIAGLLCPSEFDPAAPCGVCRTCARVAADTHPDAHRLERARDEQDKDDNQHVKKSFHVISIDQVRAAQTVLLRHAVEGRARVLHIDDADCMSEPAQNALLKTLEEPGAATFLLLETTSPEKLLPTVRSRVQRLRVCPLDSAVVAQEFGKRLPAAPMAPERAAALAHGSLGLALHAGTERAVHLHDLVLALLSTTKGLRPVATARAVLEGCRERRTELEAVRTFLWLLRAELRARLDGLAQAPAGAYGHAASEPWTTWLELTLAAERDLELMIPCEQVLTACLLQFESP